MVTERIDIVVTERGSRRVNRNLSDIGRSATASQGAVSLLRRSLGLLGGALILTNAVRTLANFSQEMSTVRAITEATEDQFTSLRDEAKRLGATTRFSATQAAEGMTFLARAGFDTAQVLGSVEGTLQLAQAGALDLGRAADIASNVLQGFRLSVDQTNRVVDVLAKGANSSNTNVEQLGEAMKFVAPVAAGLGVSVEEAAAAVGALSNAGLQASLAGTGLKRVLGELESPGSKTQKIFAQLGVKTEDVRISQVGLTKALETLREAGIDTGLALEIFGQRGGPAFEVLASSIPKVKELTNELQNAEGTAKRVAETMDQNLNGALFAVKSAFEAVIIAAGDLGLESGLTNSFRSLAAGLRFVATNIDDVTVAIQILAGAFVAMKIPALIAQFRLLALAILANPIGLFVGTLAAGVAALTVFRDQIFLTADGTITLADGMTAASNVIGQTAVDAVNSLGGSFKNFDELAKEAIENVSRGFIVLLAAANGTFRAILTVFNDFPRALKEIAVAAWNAWLTIAEIQLNTFIGAVQKALSFLGLQTDAISFNLDKLKSEGNKGGTALGDAFKQGFNDVIVGAVLEGQDRLTAAAGGKGPTGAPTAPGAPQTPVKRPAGIVEGGDGPTFAELFKDLERENQLLSVNRDERVKLAAVLDFESQLKRSLTTDERARVEALAEANELLKIQNQVLEEIRGPAEQYEQKLEAINELLRQNKINQDEANVALRDARIALLDTETSVGAGFERGFLKAQKSMEDFASSSERLITDAFAEAQSAVVTFFKTGEFSLQSFFSSLADNLLQLGTQSLFASVFGAGGALGGLAGGGGGGGGGIGGAIASIGASVLGFQNGGAFQVNSQTAMGSLSGTDNRLISFAAQDGETVSVTPRGQAPGGGGGRTVNNFNFPAGTNPTGFKRSQSQIEARQGAAQRRASAKNG